VNSEILDRLPPHNVDAEKAVLGSIILDPRVLDDVALRSEDFYVSANGCLFSHLQSMRDDGDGIDVVTLVARLRLSGACELCGGCLPGGTRAVVPYADNACITRRLSPNTRGAAVIHAATEMLRTAWDASQPIDDVIGSANGSFSAYPRANIAASRCRSHRLSLRPARRWTISPAGRGRRLMTVWKHSTSRGRLFPGELVIVAAAERGQDGARLQSRSMLRRKAGGHFGSWKCGAGLGTARSLWSLRRAMSRVRSAEIGPADLADLAGASAELGGCRSCSTTGRVDGSGCAASCRRWQARAA